MNNFSREYLFQEVVLHRHCILLNLSENILWDGNRKVDKIYMIDYCLAPSAQEQMLANITKGVNTYGAIEIKAFTDKENPTDAKKITIISDIINTFQILLIIPMSSPIQNFIPCANHPSKLAKKYCANDKCKSFIFAFALGY